MLSFRRQISTAESETEKWIILLFCDDNEIYLFSKNEGDSTIET